MKPITIVKRFLNRATPPVPLPDDIDDESTSASGSWLLLPNSTEGNGVTLHVSTADRGCQTQGLSQISYPMARSTINMLGSRSETGALSPPPFRPKSKLPRLQYGGLQAPNLHCFTSSLPPAASHASTDTEIFLQPTETIALASDIP